MACVPAPPGPLCLGVFSCPGGLLMPPALVASLPTLSPQGLIFLWPRHGDMVHICCCFVLSPSPRGRTMCNGLFCSVLFSLCLYTYFYICICGNMDADAGLAFSAFASPPTHCSLPRNKFVCTVSHPWCIPAPDLCFKERRHGKIHQCVLHLPAEGLVLGWHIETLLLPRQVLVSKMLSFPLKDLSTKGLSLCHKGDGHLLFLGLERNCLV